MMHPTANQLITAKQMTEYFGVAPSTLWRWVNEGHMPKPIHVGRRTYWEWQVVQDHLAALRSKTH